MYGYPPLASLAGLGQHTLQELYKGDPKLLHEVERLVDLQHENRGGSTDGEMERIFTEVIPAHHDRIERLRKLLPLPPAAFAVAGVDFA